MSKMRSVVLLIIVNAMWATQVPVIRIIGDKVGPMAIAFIPMIISTIIFIPFLLVENSRKPAAQRRRWKDLRYFIIPGLIGIFLMQYLYTVGSTKTLASNAGIITFSIPVLTALFASVLLKEKFNIVRAIGFVFAIGGVLLTSLPDLRGTHLGGGQYFQGNLIFLLACTCCAFYNTYCKLLVDKQFTKMEILVYSSIVGSIACIPLLIWAEPFHPSTILNGGKVVIGGILELSFVVYGFSMILFFHILKSMDVTQAILGNYLLPFFIAVFGVFLLNEKITMPMIAGSVVIIISTLMVTVYENRILAFFHKDKAGVQPPRPYLPTVEEMNK